MNKLLLFCLLSPSLFASTTFLDWWSFRILIHQTNWTGTSFAEMDLSALLDNSHHIMLLVQLCEHPKDHKAEQSDCPESSLRLGGLKQQLLPKVNDRQNDLRSSDTISSWCLSSGVAPAPADSSDQPESLLHVVVLFFLKWWDLNSPINQLVKPQSAITDPETLLAARLLLTLQRLSVLSHT